VTTVTSQYLLNYGVPLGQQMRASPGQRITKTGAGLGGAGGNSFDKEGRSSTSGREGFSLFSLVLYPEKLEDKGCTTAQRGDVVYPERAVSVSFTAVFKALFLWSLFTTRPSFSSRSRLIAHLDEKLLTYSASPLEVDHLARASHQILMIEAGYPHVGDVSLSWSLTVGVPARSTA